MGWDGAPQAAAEPPLDQSPAQTDFPQVDMSQFEAVVDNEAPMPSLPDFPPADFAPASHFSSDSGEGALPPLESASASEPLVAAEPAPVLQKKSPRPAPPPKRAQTGAETTAEISDFGNAIDAKALSYDIVIEGIETAELLEELKDCLRDPRFGWDLPTVLSEIKEGRLELRGLNGPKAIVLYNRVKFLNLETTVRQSLYVAGAGPVSP